MAIPVVGIPARPLLSTDHPARPLLAQYRVYVTALETAGAAVLIIPPLGDEARLRAIYDRCDGLCLAGGPDVDPVRYGQTVAEGCGVTIEPVIDSAELAIARWAIADDRPILGVCRGVQVLNVACGGTLWQDLPTQHSSDIGHRHEPIEGLAHPVIVEPTSRLATVLGVTDIEVNSMHHQAIRDVGAPLRATAHAPDGVVEAVESSAHRFLLGVQWHPEELVANPVSLALFCALAESC